MLSWKEKAPERTNKIRLEHIRELRTSPETSEEMKQQNIKRC